MGTVSVELDTAAPPTSANVVVLGGGPAGLAAAWELAEHGVGAIVLERSGRPGGLCTTAARDGFRFDLGGHRILRRRHELVRRVTRLLGDELLVRQRRSVIFFGGERFEYPLKAPDLLRKLPARVLARATVDFARERVRRGSHDGSDASFEQWVVRRFGRTLYDIFFGPYTAKLWGIAPSELSADWASQRISALNLAHTALGAVRRGLAPRTHAHDYLYPRLGIGQLFEAVTDATRAGGVRVISGVEVVGLTRGARGRITSVECRGDAGWHASIRCDALISTAPLATLARLVAPEDPAAQSLAERLRHRALRIVNLCLRGESVLGATWAYVADGTVPMTRIQEPSARSPAMVPPGHASLMVEVPSSGDDAWWRCEDALAVERVTQALSQLGIDVRGRLVSSFTTRARDAYPVYLHGYDRIRQALFDRVAETPNVWTTGRQGLFRYVFMDTAMEMGFAAAREWMGGTRPSAERMMSIDDNPSLLEVQTIAA